MTILLFSKKKCLTIARALFSDRKPVSDIELLAGLPDDLFGKSQEVAGFCGGQFVCSEDGEPCWYIPTYFVERIWK